MRLLALALLALLPQQGPPVIRRPLTLVSWDDDVMRQGLQVCVSPPSEKAPLVIREVQVFYKGKPIPSWFDEKQGTWFKLQADIPPRGRDAEYEVRGGGVVKPQGAEVFEFFEDFETTDLDPAKWEWDRGLTFTRDDRGLALATLPAGRSEHAPASLIPRLGSIPKGFIFEAYLAWNLPDTATFTFAVKVEIDHDSKTTAEARERIAKAIAGLGAEEIEIRDRSTKELVKAGPAAVPQLVEAAASGEAEVRARATSAIDAIYRENPPPAIATGYTALGAADKRLDLMMQLGKYRAVLKSAAAPEVRRQKVTIWRDADGEASISWDERRPRLFPVDGKTGRIRLDFWAPAAGTIGDWRITRVILRKFVDALPVAEFGKPEPVK